MNNFCYYTPTKVVFGENTHREVGRLIKEQNFKKVLIHYGGGSVVRSGLLDDLKSNLSKENIDYIELGGVVPNPHLSLALKGIELVKKEKVDFILAVGGGSVIDSAKCIAYGATNQGDVWDFYTGKRVPGACLPLGCVLTIAAAGSEMSASSVITKETTKEKRSCNSDLSRPVFAVMNPQLTMSLPAYQTASGCTDIMMHTMERYFNSGDNMDVTDAISESLMRNVMKYALVLKEHPKDYKARAEMMWAGSLCHNGLTGCGIESGDFATHNLEHELGGMFDVTHGAGLAAIWPSWARYVYKECPERFKQFATHVMGIPDEGDEEAVIVKGIEAMEQFYRNIDLPINMRELGITPTEEEIDKMAQMCTDAYGFLGNVKKLYKDDMVAIYRMAK